MHIYEVIPSWFIVHQENITIWILTISFHSSACLSCGCLLSAGTTRRNTFCCWLQCVSVCNPAAQGLCHLGPLMPLSHDSGSSRLKTTCTPKGCSGTCRRLCFPTECHTGPIKDATMLSDSKFCKHKVQMSKAETTFTYAKLSDKWIKKGAQWYQLFVRFMNSQDFSIA